MSGIDTLAQPDTTPLEALQAQIRQLEAEILADAKPDNWYIPNAVDK